MERRTLFSTDDGAGQTLVVLVPTGWYVSKTMCWPGSQRGMSTHAVVVADAEHEMSPGDFAGDGEEVVAS